jgi:hypothetical protein
LIVLLRWGTMKLSTFAVTSVLSLAAIVSPLFFPSTAYAQTAGMDGSYIGVGVSPGITNGGNINDSAVFGGHVQGRLQLGRAPVSLRGAVIFGGDTTAFVPTLTYDAPIADNTNLYIGGGASFVGTEGSISPLGNRNSFVVTGGVETAVDKSWVVYSDVKLGLNAYKNSGGSAASVQVGVGYRF